MNAFVDSPAAALSALAEQHGELDRMVRGLTDAGWRSASRCESWSVADVLLHLSLTDRMAIGSLLGRFDDELRVLVEGVERAGSVDDGAALMVAHHRGRPGAEVHAAWRAGADELRALLADVDPHRRVQWVAGMLSSRTLAVTRLAECWIHTGDIAGGLGVERVPGDRVGHIARLAWRTLPYAFEREGRTLVGPVAFELRAPSGAMWAFDPEGGAAATRVTGDALDLCMVAGRRVDPAATTLSGTGPDVDAVLALVRTYA